MAINTGPSFGGMPGFNFNFGQMPAQQSKPRRGGAGGMVDPNFRRMMQAKAAGGVDNPALQGRKPMYGPGAFGVSPELYYQHFGQGGRVRQPQQQQQQQNPMGMGMFNPFMMNNMGGGMMGGGQGIDTGPSQDMMRQFNMGGMSGGIWNPVYSGGPDTSGMMGQMRNRGIGRYY